MNLQFLITRATLSLACHKAYNTQLYLGSIINKKHSLCLKKVQTAQSLSTIKLTPLEKPNKMNIADKGEMRGKLLPLIYCTPLL